MLYVCCKIFPIRRGTAKLKISGNGFPSVILFAISKPPKKKKLTRNLFQDPLPVSCKAQCLYIINEIISM
jgi:hypothetical protein